MIYYKSDMYNEIYSQLLFNKESLNLNSDCTMIPIMKYIPNYD